MSDDLLNGLSLEHRVNELESMIDAPHAGMAIRTDKYRYGREFDQMSVPSGWIKALILDWRRLRKANEELVKILKEMAECSYFDDAEGPELKAQNANLHRLAKKALQSSESDKLKEIENEIRID